RDREKQPSVESHEKQQRQHERKVVISGEDVLHAQHRVSARELAHPTLVVRRAEQLHLRLRRGERVNTALPVEPVDFHDGSGKRFADAFDFQRAAQARLATMHDGFVRVARLGPVQRQFLCHRPLVGNPRPQELTLRALAELELGHRHFVGRQVRGPGGQERQQQQPEGAFHRETLATSILPAGKSPPGTLTVYLFSIASTAASRFSAIVASIQSCSTARPTLSKSAGTPGWSYFARFFSNQSRRVFSSKVGVPRPCSIMSRTLKITRARIAGSPLSSCMAMPSRWSTSLSSHFRRSESSSSAFGSRPCSCLKAWRAGRSTLASTVIVCGSSVRPSMM